MALLIVLCVEFIVIFFNLENCLVKKKFKSACRKEETYLSLIQATILQVCQIHLKFLYVVS